MDLFARYQTEQDPVYQQVEAANNLRYSGFLISMIESAIASDQRWLTEPLIKAINFHAIVALFPEAGRYRSVPVYVGDYTPPPADQVKSLMQDLVNTVNENWNDSPSIPLAAHALWRINQIHPFVNGNGRTARAICYFIICVKSGGVLPGSPTLPDRLRQPSTRTEYVRALQLADKGDPSVLVSLIQDLITEQLS